MEVLEGQWVALAGLNLEVLHQQVDFVLVLFVLVLKDALCQV
jgi:hypothetical protein